MSSKKDEFCTTNEKLCILNKKLCIKNVELCNFNGELCRDIGFVGVPVLVGALVDATSLEMGMRGLSLGVCGSAAVYAMGAIPVPRKPPAKTSK